MTLHIYNDIQQGSERWHELRRGIVTASEAGKLITAKTIKPAANIDTRALAQLLTAERITGWTEPTYVSDDMERGWEDEPLALEVYAQHFAPVESCGFMVRDDWGFSIGYSPDGLVGEDGLVEVKSRVPKRQVYTVLADKVPSENYAQLQTGLLVSGRKWVDYLSYCGGMALYRKRVYPDPIWFEAITEAVALFEQNSADMVAAYTKATANLPATKRVNRLEMSL